MSQDARFTIEQPLSCTPEEAYDAWMDPATLVQWFCPDPGWHASIPEWDARIGGAFNVVMSDGKASVPHTGEFLVLDRPRRLVMTWISEFTANEASRVTLEFLPANEGTLLRLTHEGLPHSQATREHEEGWAAILRLLAERF
jgi:uncharacterized protein YndB with AHSA1/START domain